MQTNAVAGPSSLYLPPTPPSSQPVYLKSTNDLLSQFLLKDAYDKYVKPQTTDPTSPTAADKGKGKETVATPLGDGHDQDDDDAPEKGEKKKKNSYKHLIKGIPGKHSTRKDDYLMNTMQVPPKQRVRIAPFDFKTQTDAFEVSLEGLKGWNQATLILESAQAREDRKKRKELKKLAKAQIQGQGAIPSQTPLQAQPPPTSSTPKPFTPSSVTAASASTPSSLPPRTSTPQPQRPQFSTTPRPNPHAHPPSTASAAPSSTPASAAAVPRPGVTPNVIASGGTVHHPNPRNHVPTPVQIPTQRVSTPLRTATPTTATAPHPLSAPPLSAGSIGTGIPGAQGQQLPRGKKRELEESTYGATQQQPKHMNGHLNGVSQQPSATLTGVRAGNNGVRPRPIKKQRMDAPGHAREPPSAPPVQQPTPQGV
ncbi:hypothetical protein V5O48_013181 [Marasmius crinis-equi]|uniref:Uncharacterized protein n=1 Tax=Marasmius crinis-equi TaxID=585013 RepID=A0ABR3F0U6_9AGAR